MGSLYPLLTPTSPSLGLFYHGCPLCHVIIICIAVLLHLPCFSLFFFPFILLNGS